MSSSRDSNLGQISGVLTFVPVIFLAKEIISSWRYCFIIISFQAVENIFIPNRTQYSFSELWICSCDILAETKKFGLDSVLLSRLLSELQDPPSPGLELTTNFPEL
jgi:hypothetical protein